MIGYIGNVDIANIVIEAEVVPTVVGGTRVEAKVMNIPHAASKGCFGFSHFICPVIFYVFVMLISINL